ncbi:hypothetical protein BDD12DRAFT_891642 [Trichophaea hybrida]|nr:hypothetical protein BDD12DRAFT_891642 [Trichophaea hybrida]
MSQGFDTHRLSPPSMKASISLLARMGPINVRGFSSATSYSNNTTALRAFFASFADFKHDPCKDANMEFQRLCAHRGWHENSKRLRKAKNKFNEAMAVMSSSLITATTMTSATTTSTCTASTASASSSKNITSLARFFAKFEDFIYDSGRTANEEFQRLCNHRGWGEKRLKKIRNEFDKALAAMTPCIITTTSVACFFAKFGDFNYDSSRKAKGEFQRLCTLRKWGEKKLKKLRNEFKNVLVAMSPSSSFEEMTPISKFFAGFKDFSYDPNQEVAEEFQRLCTQRGWGEKMLKTVQNRFDKALECIDRTTTAASINRCPTTSPVNTFFSAFRDFTHNRHQPAAAEFKRLSAQKRWSCDSAPFREARKGFGEAIEIEFNTVFGSGEVDWKYLCLVLGVDPMPKSITQARNVALPPINVNIFDLCDYEKVFRSKKECSNETSGNVPKASKLEFFPTVKALAKYSKKNDKIYPRKVAKKQGALRFMLRRIG